MMITDTFTTLNMDGLLVQILRLHDHLLNLEDFEFTTPTQQESLMTMQELSANLCALWVTDDELADLTTIEKSILRHDFMNPLHGIMGFASLILREGLTHNMLGYIQQIKQMATIIQQDVIVITKGLLPEMVE